MDDKINITPDARNYDRYATFILDREFILTQDKMLLKGMPYLYSEGRHHVAVRLLEAWLDYELEEEFIYLSLQELETDKTFKVSWNLDYSGSYYLWTIADLPSIMNISKWHE